MGEDFVTQSQGGNDEESQQSSSRRRERTDSSDSLASLGRSSSAIAQIEAYTVQLARLRASVKSFNVADIATAGDEFYVKIGEMVAEEEKEKA